MNANEALINRAKELIERSDGATAEALKAGIDMQDATNHAHSNTFLNMIIKAEIHLAKLELYKEFQESIDRNLKG